MSYMKKRTVKKKKIIRTNRGAFLSVAVIVLILVGVLSYRCVSLYQKNQEYVAQKAELEAELTKEQERSEELKEYESYVGTDDYIIRMAREKLGLVFKDETVFRSEDSEE